VTRALAIHDEHLVVAFSYCEIWANTAGRLWMRCQCGHKTVNRVLISVRYCEKCKISRQGAFRVPDLRRYPELHPLIGIRKRMNRLAKTIKVRDKYPLNLGIDYGVEYPLQVYYQWQGPLDELAQRVSSTS